MKENIVTDKNTLTTVLDIIDQLGQKLSTLPGTVGEVGAISEIGAILVSAINGLVHQAKKAAT